MGAALRSLGLVLIFVAMRAAAQGVAVSVARSQLQALDGPSATAAGPSDISKASVNVSGDNSAASSQLAYVWPVQGAHGALTGSVLAAAPFSDSNAPKPELGSVSSLSAGVNARVGVGWLFLPLLTHLKAATYTDAFNEVCEEFIKAALGSRYYYNPGPSFPESDPKGLHALSIQPDAPSCHELTQSTAMLPFVSKLNAAIDERNKSGAANAPKEEHVLLQPGWQDKAKFADAEMKALDTKRFTLLQGVGLSLLGNQHSYSYVTAAAPTKVIKQSLEGYGIGASYSALLPHMSILFGFSYERPFKAGSGQQVCSPIGTTSSTTCSTAAVGAPMRTTARIVSAEVRALLSPGLAISPRIEYDTAAANLGIKLPAYFVADPKHILSGGLQIGWTKKDRYQGAVVIQKAFTFLD